MKVLIVDDDDGDVMLTESCLHSNDNRLEIVRAFDGADALTLLEEDSHRPDLILLDLNMPGIDGHKTLESIRKTEGLQTVPVVIFSTSSSQSDIERAYRNCANAYVQKPADLKNFQKTITNIQAFWLHTARTVKSA
ncbi:MAG: two-component system response regulator [Hyphobacterium sp.]|nr:MAG: two-component system response regulator [Hyphobacterium sp.]